MHKAEQEVVSRKLGIYDGRVFWIQRGQKTQGLLTYPHCRPLLSTYCMPRASMLPFLSTSLQTPPWLARFGEDLDYRQADVLGV